jgi:hypothetical protein
MACSDAVIVAGWHCSVQALVHACVCLGSAKQRVLCMYVCMGLWHRCISKCPASTHVCRWECLCIHLHVYVCLHAHRWEYTCCNHTVHIRVQRTAAVYGSSCVSIGTCMHACIHTYIHGHTYECLRLNCTKHVPECWYYWIRMRNPWFLLMYRYDCIHANIHEHTHTQHTYIDT